MTAIKKEGNAHVAASTAARGPYDGSFQEEAVKLLAEGYTQLRQGLFIKDDKMVHVDWYGRKTFANLDAYTVSNGNELLTLRIAELVQTPGDVLVLEAYVNGERMDFSKRRLVGTGYWQADGNPGYRLRLDAEGCVSEFWQAEPE